jgi:diketogulonate reductase-like aldo/keto reductase
MSVPMIKFNNGEVFPSFGLGTWKVAIQACLQIFVIILFRLNLQKWGKL